MRNEHFMRSWAGDPRVVGEIIIRSDLVGAKGAGDAPAVIGATMAGVPLDDDVTNLAMAEDLAMGREDAGEMWDDPLANDTFDFSMNPGKLGAEVLGWYQRSPGEFLGENPVTGNAGVKGVSRWFMMFADAAVDTVSDRVVRAAGQASQETGKIGWDNTMEFGEEWMREFFTGEDIGNKPFWSAMADAIQFEHQNQGTGYIANSELAPDVEEGMLNFDKATAEHAMKVQEKFDNRETDPWWDNNSMYATPSSYMMEWEDSNRQAEFSRLVDLSPEQAALGDPFTQKSQFKQDALGFTVGGGATNIYTNVEGDAQGRGHYSRFSLGRVAASVIAEPGTSAYHNISGGIDFAKQIFYDPLNYVGIGAVGKANAARRGIGLTKQAGRHLDDLASIETGVKAIRAAPSPYQLEETLKLKKAGVMFEENPRLIKEIYEQPVEADAILLAQRSRKTVVGEDANKWLTGSQASPMVDALREADTTAKVDAILDYNTSRVNANMRGQLRDAKTNGEVIEALMPHVTGMKLKGSLRRSSEIASYSVADMLKHPLRSTGDALYLGIDRVTEAGLDRMYQVQQRGVGALVGRGGEHLDMPIANLNSRGQVRNLMGESWGGRMTNNQSNAAISTKDIDVGYKALRRLVRNFGMKQDLKIARTKKGNIVQGSTMEEMTASLEKGDSILKGSLYDVDEQMYNFSQLGNGNEVGAFRSARNIWNAAALKMEADGVDTLFIRAVTSLMDDQGQNALFFTNAMGETGKYPGTGFQALIDGKVYAQPGPQLVRELFSGNINVPDPRLLRRTLAEKSVADGGVREAISSNLGRRQLNALTTNKTRRIITTEVDGFKGFKRVVRNDLQDRTAMRYARMYISNIWKPAKILRFGYIPKIILGDEQGRMTAAGLASMWAPGRISKGDSPIAYFAYLFGKKGSDDVTGNPLKNAQMYMDTVSLKNNSFGEVGAMRSDSWERALRGSEEYVDGLATEWVQLGSDPIVIKMMNPEEGTQDAIAATRKWLMEDKEGQEILETIFRSMKDQDPFSAEQFKNGGQQLDNYLQWVNARIHLKTGGDYVYRNGDGVVLSSADIPVNGYDDVAEGITIIRQGDTELLEGLRNGDVGGVNLRNITEDSYKDLRSIARDKVNLSEDAFAGTDDIAAVRFPEAVKYNSGQNTALYTDKKLPGRVIDGLMDWIVSKPASYLNRAPAFKQYYWEAIGERLPYATDELAATIEAAAKEAGVWRRVKNAANDVRKNNETYKSLTDMDDLDLYAKSSAATNVQDLLFDFAERKNMFDAIGLISPFADAWLELFTSWGRLFAKDPRMVRRPMKAYQELQQDNPLEWGMDEYDSNEGFFHQNQYGDEVFSIPGAASITNMLKKIPGIDENLPEMDFEVKIEGLNMIATQLYPGVGDVITVPASQLIPKSPEYKWLRDNLAPFGLPDNPQEGLWNATIGASPTLNRFMNGWFKGELAGGTQERMFTQTASWMLRDMIASGEVTAADLQDPDKNAGVWATAEARAQDVYLIRGIMQATLPAAPGPPEFIVNPETLDSLDPDSAQLLISLNDTAQTYYNILQEEADGDELVAMDTFTDRYGFNPMMNLVSMSGTEWKRGVTEGALDFEQNHPDWFESFGATAYYLRPDREGDDFYYEAWASQFDTGERKAKTLADQSEEYIYRMASLQYKQAEKDIDAALQSGDLIVPEGTDQDKYRDAILDMVDQEIKQSFPTYEAMQGNWTDERRKKMILEFRQWDEHSDISQSDTGKTMNTFFGAWDQMAQSLMDARGTKQATLPFRKTSSKVGGESWQQRAIVNATLIEVGNALALEPDAGNFKTAWEEVIRPTIYDYGKDVGQDQSSPVDPEEERIAKLMKEWGL